MKSTPAKLPFFDNPLHLGVVVKDMDQAVKRLESLGIGPFEPYDSGSTPPLIGKPLFRGKPMDSEQKIFKAKIGEVVLELFQPVKGESPWKEFLDSKGEGIHHIGFDVDDLDEEAARLTGQGAAVLSRINWQGGGGMYLEIGAGGLIFELDKR